MLLNFLKNIYDWLNKIGGTYKGGEYSNGVIIFVIIFLWILIIKIVKKNKGESNTN